MTGIHNNMKNIQRRGGFTLIELMVTVGLFMIIIAIAVGSFTNALRTQREVSSLISAQSNVSLAVEQMAREIRTGYLFCHAPTSTSPLSSCGPCTVTGSPTDPTWLCSSLVFYDAQGNHVEYTLPTTGAAAGTLATVDPDIVGATPQSITGNGVTVKYLGFRLFGQEEGDNTPPRVTIVMGIAPSSTDPAIASDTFNLQTTVSARQIDCGTSGGILQC